MADTVVKLQCLFCLCSILLLTSIHWNDAHGCDSSPDHGHHHHLTTDSPNDYDEFGAEDVPYLLHEDTFHDHLHEHVHGDDHHEHHHHHHHHEADHSKTMYSAASNIGSSRSQSYYQRYQEAKRRFKDQDDNPNNYEPIGCGRFIGQVKSDLEPWRDSGILESHMSRAKETNSVILYQIRDGKLYRSKDCMFPGRCEGVEHFLHEMLNETSSLPDMELVINVRDYPAVHLQGDRSELPPIFSFSKQVNTNGDILYPAWSFWCGGPAIEPYPKGIGRWDLARNRIEEASPSWRNKESKAFFRGSRTSKDRDPLILLSREKPDLVDAKYTKNQAWRSNADTLDEDPAPSLPLEESCKYKYLFNMRGVAASFRYKHLFLCKSVVLNVESDWIEFFYPQLEPWYHYVPVSSNYDDAEDLIKFLKEQDDIAFQIAENGFQFIWRFLKMDSIKCYWRYLLEQYHSLIKYEMQPDENLILIEPPKSSPYY